MAEAKSLTMSEVVANATSGEGVDFLHEAVRLIVQQLMEAEITQEIGAAHGEICAERSRLGAGRCGCSGHPGRECDRQQADPRCAFGRPAPPAGTT